MTEFLENSLTFSSCLHTCREFLVGQLSPRAIQFAGAQGSSGQKRQQRAVSRLWAPHMGLRERAVTELVPRTSLGCGEAPEPRIMTWNVCKEPGYILTFCLQEEEQSAPRGATTPPPPLWPSSLPRPHFHFHEAPEIMEQ